MVDVLRDLGTVGAVWVFTAFDSMKVFIERNMTCAELYQYACLSAAKVLRCSNETRGG